MTNDFACITCVKQTDKHTNTCKTRVKHNLLGRGKYKILQYWLADVIKHYSFETT